MPSKANNAGGGGGGSADSSTYHTPRYVNGRRASARRGEAAKSRNADKHTSTAAEAGAAVAAAAKSTTADITSTTRPEHGAYASHTTERQQQLDEGRPHRQGTAAPTSSSRALNALSPAFIPRQYQQGGEASGALSFSSATSPLAYMGSTGVASSVSSPLTFTASMTNTRHSIMSPMTPSLSEQTNTPLFPHASNNCEAVVSTSAMQLRDAYARAAAAKATTTTTTTTTTNRSTRSTSLTSQLMQPSPATQPDTAGVRAFNLTEGGASSAATLPSQQRQHRAPPPSAPSQGSSVRATAGSTPAAASGAVYGPSVSVFHPQFIDVTTGATSMTPFALNDDNVDELVGVGDASGEAWMQGEVAALAQEIIDAVPRQLQHVQQQQQLQTAVPRRMCATTVAVLASHDAPTAQLSVSVPTRRSERTQQSQPASIHAVPSVSTQEATRPKCEEMVLATATARPPPSSQRHKASVTTATSSAPATNAASYNTAEEAHSQETPQRRPRQAAANANTTTTTTASADARSSSGALLTAFTGAESGANTVERLYACMANTDERTEDGRSVTSKMGLTGSVRRGVQPRYGDNDERNDDERGMESSAVTPTATPAKVLAVEGSPFVAAAAAESITADPLRLNRRLLTEEDSAIIFSESSLSESTRSGRAPQPQSQPPHATPTNTNLQRAIMQFMAQIQTNNCKAAAAAAAATTTSMVTTAAPSTAAATTPQKPSANTHASSELTSTSFKTPEMERVPSARPSATRNPTCRTITTIIHTPNTTFAGTHTSSNNTSVHSTRAADAPPATADATKNARGAQRSLASCLEAIAPAKTAAARQSHNAVPEAAAAHANSNAMPVPRSQRRVARQAGSTNNVTAPSSSVVNNSSIASNATTTTHAETHATSPLLVNLRASPQAMPYAVVVDGHMGRRVTAVSTAPLKAGACVLFEEDRGVDMGRVVQCDKLEDGDAFDALPTLASATSPLSRKDRPASVLRPATAEEEYRWLYTDVKEAEATLEPCREAAARLGLPVRVVGAIYQFNKTKLTFYYESDSRVDFRPLLPTLFSRFHCRIWMARMETPTTTEGARKDATAMKAEASA
ncbi:hypothetical protein ABL78_2247 [Leptomonas seymouri]|uniref:PSP1 C-terminal domain-containing protein n=1 Tax=Leptomonas seymouri TaxID=5684 RepID=A0A0N1I9G3_LEPSE|nr:hypothetical protein ABL78_2247 [Leptomonas seymouri]|eukprot:KPI88643.1 hypothetical protein ABL78_2247 [Leptomonas seymouri]